MDFAQAVPMGFIIETVLIIFVMVGIGIVAVRRAKKAKENE